MSGVTLKTIILSDALDMPREVTERLTDMGKTTLSRNDNNTAKKTTTTKKTRLLANPDIRRWYDNLARGSKLTAECRLRKLGRFCEVHNMTPMELAALAMKDLRTATDLLEDHVTMLESQGYSPGTVDDQLKTIKSWLRHFDVVITRKIKVSSSNFTPTLQNERVPNASEINEIYSRADMRESAIISLMAKSGLRPEVMGNSDGTDGLRMRDMPDLVVHQGEAKCMRTPCRVVVRRELSKAGHQYFTFLTELATRHVIAYLNDRLAHGEPLHGDSPVISPDYTHSFARGKNSGKEFLPTPRISGLVRSVFRPRFHWRPYVLRPYFDTQLLIAESKGRIAHDFRVFFMGHKGTIEARYTTNKGIIPDALLDEMRDAYARSEEFLDQTENADHMLESKRRAQTAIDSATPEQLDLVLEVLSRAGKMAGQAAATS